MAFSGTEDDYTARDFILQCEDVMNYSFVSDPGDKISFVRSRLQPGSRASALMQASAFTVPQERRDYAAFRSHFLETFGDDVKHSLVKGVNLCVDTLRTNAGTKGLIQGQVDAYRLSTDLIKCLKEGGWTDGENMSLDNTLKFLEFLIYMIVLKDQYRKSSLSLEFGPDDKLHDFVLKLKTKIEEEEGAACPAVAGVRQENANSNASASSVVASTTGKPKFKCSYCQRDGHTVYYCKMRRQMRKTKSAKGDTHKSGNAAPNFTSR